MSRVEIQSPYIESFLKREGGNDLLWKHYARYDNYAQAAVILSKIVDTDPQLSLEKRLDHLSMALGMAQSCLGPSSMVTKAAADAGVTPEFVQDLSDKIEVSHCPRLTFCQVLIQFCCFCFLSVGCAHSARDPQQPSAGGPAACCRAHS